MGGQGVEENGKGNASAGFDLPSRVHWVSLDGFDAAWKASFGAVRLKVFIPRIPNRNETIKAASLFDTTLPSPCNSALPDKRFWLQLNARS
ncbi:unnamed protein product [Allacma fusca]|uniref:Uncharacterized protein n=1 Tax=Allacma fusca TaxID=39272 RepID=A0A8J2LA78_9HEXA|nr:unnamed protein product [Allacma fusca]